MMDNKRVLVLYQAKGASHRVVSSLLDSYKYRVKEKQTHIDLHCVCEGKVNIRKYIEKHAIEKVYVYHLMEAEIEQLKSIGVPYVTYTRSDYVIAHKSWKGYIEEYSYTLLHEIETEAKERGGKMTIYMPDVLTCGITPVEVYVCDRARYTGKGYDTEHDAYVALVQALEDKKKQEEGAIEYALARIEKYKQSVASLGEKIAEIEKLVSGSEKM